MVRRIVMVRREQYEQLSSGCFVTIDGVPTYLLPIAGQSSNTPSTDSEHASECFSETAPPRRANWYGEGDRPIPDSPFSFVLLPKDANRAIGCVVSEVLGTEDVNLESLHALPDDPYTLGAAVLRNRITPILDFRKIIDAAAAPIRAPQFAPSVPAARARILLVDDTQFFREVVGRHLSEAGYDVTTAEHGAAALDALERGYFDIVVSDLEMPIMDGWALAAAVRQNEALKHLPLLALTTLTGDQARADAMAHGFDAFEVKLDPTSLVTAVRQLLDSRCQARRGE
jgi:two-component system chemotaxis sensor kinase CheA